MRRWVVVFLGLIITFTSSPLTIFAAGRRPVADLARYIYRRAAPADLLDIQKLLRQATEEDRHRLLLLPEPFRTEALSAAIEKGRIFIAIDPDKPVTRQHTKVVSMLKVFVMGRAGIDEDSDSESDDEELTEAQDEAEKEKIDILQNELRATGRPGRPKIQPSTAGIYTYPYTFTFQPDREPIFAAAPRIRYSLQPRQTYVYFGAAFTAPGYRGQGVSTQLERFALEEIKDDILEDIIERRSERLFYIYGVVEANAGSKGRIRVFSAFVQYIKSNLHLPIDNDRTRPVKLRFFRFNTFKPEFDVRRNKLVKRADQPENAGYGCFIECPLHGATYTE